MTRYAIDADVAVQVLRRRPVLGPGDSLVAPSVLRSQVLSTLYREVRAGALDRPEARRQLELLAELKIRLLGDRVSRARAWDLAERLGWPDTQAAEYLAVAALQADVLVTDDHTLATAALGLVTVVGSGAFFADGGPGARG